MPVGMGGVDGLDVGILRALFQGQGLAPVNVRTRTPLRVVAAKLGVSEGTVRRRVSQFRESGFIRDVRLIPNPRLMGLAEANVLVDVPKETSMDDLLAECRLLEDTVILAVFHGGLLSVVFRHRGEAELVRRVELIQRLARADRATVGRIPFPPCTLRPLASDWAIIRAFHRDPGRTCDSVAREVRASSRTVKRRLERILGGYAALVLPDFDVSNAPGGSMGTILIEYPAEMMDDVDRGVNARIGERIFTIFHMLPFRNSDPAVCGYNFVAANVPKGRELLREVRAVRGVRAARVEWFERADVNYEPFAEDLRTVASRATP